MNATQSLVQTRSSYHTLRARPAMKVQRPASRGVVQRSVERERDLVGVPMTDTGGSVSVGQTLGHWTLNLIGDQADVWYYAGNQWKASYYRISGDYHVKGVNMPRRAYEKGTFNGSFRETGGDTYAAERDAVYTSFQDDVIDHVPGYRR